MKKIIKYIKEDVEVVGERHATNVEDAIAFEEEPFLLPVKTEDELNTVEKELSNPMNVKKLIKSLVHLAPGKSVPQTVGAIMSRSISNELASTYSWKGQKKKSAFQQKELAKAIVASVATKYPQEARQEIIKSIQLWLAQSTSRLKRAQQAAEKAREEI
ncbi:uncharacterized protein LOC116164330 [Photinus pyralis]|uniref:uncharacterized protein LOC116159194 n=1 Tax=Photinus pyralis TaxID=7054 RepID=UPI0012670481|nr:uncharacterized protein LOC116159194 [Photinus pyralis]XP_031334362.1 uncharacterized protein LOC116164330 [Photinus pyralis]